MSFTLGLPAPIARFIRAIVSSGLAAGMAVALSQIDAVKDLVMDVVTGIPGLDVNSEATVAAIVVAIAAAVIVAADKYFRENGVYGNGLE